MFPGNTIVKNLHPPTLDFEFWASDFISVPADYFRLFFSRRRRRKESLTSPILLTVLGCMVGRRRMTASPVFGWTAANLQLSTSNLQPLRLWTLDFGL